MEHEKGGDFTSSLPISSPRGVAKDISTGLRRYIGNQLGPSEPALAHSTAHSSDLVGDDQFLSGDLGMTPSLARGSKEKKEREVGGGERGPSDQTHTMTTTTRKKLKHFQLKFRDLTPWQDYKVSGGSASSGNQINPVSTKGRVWQIRWIEPTTFLTFPIHPFKHVQDSTCLQGILHSIFLLFCFCITMDKARTTEEKSDKGMKRE